ncbi:MAG: hypothetical protein ACR2NX_09675 [Chthoniobacterales bacterium]
MNRDEAQNLLSAYRPGGEDVSDHYFADALAEAEHDPVLAEWFTEQQRFDAAMSDALGAVSVPKQLRAQIFAGRRTQPTPAWSFSRAALAIAAGFVLLAAVGFWFLRAPGLDQWQSDALAIVPTLGTSVQPFDHKDPDAAVLQKWLAQKDRPSPSAIPVNLEALPALGCKTFASDGMQVSIICFKLPGGELVHLVVADGGKLSRPPPGQPRFVSREGWHTASWSANGRAYMLATKGSESELRDVLPSA